MTELPTLKAYIDRKTSSQYLQTLKQIVFCC